MFTTSPATIDSPSSGRRAEGDDRLAGVDSDPDLQVAWQLDGDVADDEGGTHGTLGVVAVGERRAEHAHHRVADELLDHSAERLDLVPDPLVVRRQQPPNLLGVELLGPSGEADEVDEDDRHDPPFVGRRGGVGEPRAAGQAEASERRGSPARTAGT